MTKLHAQVGVVLRVRDEAHQPANVASAEERVAELTWNLHVRDLKSAQK